MIHRCRILTPCIALLATALPAADGPSATASVIIVTGETISRDQQETLTSVTVRTGADLEQRPGPGRLDDVLRDAANVAVVDGIFAIRGITNVAAGSAPLIGMTVDDAWISPDQFRWSRTAPGLWDADQVEVLRGPQSTERGASSIGGAVVMRTADPTWHHEGRARLVGAGYDTYQLAAAHGGPIVDDHLAFRVAVNAQGSDGYLEDPAGRDDYGRSRQVEGRGKLLWQVLGDDRLTAKLTVSALDGITNNQNANAWTAEPEERRPDPALEGLDRIDQDVDARTAILDLRWLASTAWTVDATSTASGFETRGDYAVLGVPDYFRYDDRSLTQEIRVGYAGDRIEAVAGLWLAAYQDRFDGIQGGGAMTIDSDEQRNALAAFAAVDWHITERLTLAVGLRGEHERYTIDYTANGLGGTDDMDGGVLLPRAGVRYDLTRTTSVGAQVSRGYRGGGSSFNMAQNRFQAYDPEHLTSYEATLRVTPAPGISLGLNGFLGEWDDKQVSIFQGPGLGSFIENAAGATTRGLELEGRLGPAAVEGLSLLVSAGLLDATYDTYTSGGNDFSGNRIEYSPRWNASLQGTYRWQAGPYGSVAIRHIDEAYDSAANNDARTVFDATTVDARIGAVIGPVDAYLFATNLTDTYYEVRNQSDFYVQPAAPRVVGVGLEAAW